MYFYLAMSVKTKNLPLREDFFVFRRNAKGIKGAGKIFLRNVIIFVDIFGTLMI